MQVNFFPVVLYCNEAELIKRIQGENRHGKITDSEVAMKRIHGRKLFVPTGAFEIDTSELSAEEVAKIIIKRIERISDENLAVTSVTTK